ncbi:BadF/BadG/BcrA/BcrD ATPase family protein [Streptomyces sp. KAU_LT]|uniref:N-acetylglucosamine kinase n=1 Tax=Streptomyces sp. KAU_LT TaxID=3046669 RepID=UPI0024B6669D|nr:BadF/BadG/BcrA/BcrD ATPase family protein [Streptomyces sp. KAU_LT]MDI9830517.1 BadF/BadG/BcrA/BcrD ATPase family protein [Streptomyces sp. KAU_LT]
MTADHAGAPAYVVGVDAGGTRTRAVLAPLSGGPPLGEGRGGPGNALSVSEADLTRHLAAALAAAVPPGLRGRVVAVAGGFAGASRPPADEPGHLRAHTALTAALRRTGIGAGAVEVHGDAEVAFASAPGGPADGIAVIAGTGAVAVRVTGRVCGATAGGDGWLLGDDGSGFWMGREAVRAALRAADGRGGPTTLTRSVGHALGVPPDVLPPVPYDGTGWDRERREAYRMRLLPAVMGRHPVGLAELAPLVATAAVDGDAVAGAVLATAADHLTDLVHALAPRPGERIVLTGGLLGPTGPLTPPLLSRLGPLDLTPALVPDGCRGAVTLARLAARGLSRR